VDVYGSAIRATTRRSIVAVAVASSLITAAGCSPSTPRASRMTDAPATTRPTKPALLTPTGPALVPLPPISASLLLSASFISTTTGWVLGESPCSDRRCFSLLKTLDGGVSWSQVTAPPFSASPAYAEFEFARIVFADADDGWAYDDNEEVGATGYQLFATHDGGSTWTQIQLGAPNKWGIAALDTAAGHVWAVIYGDTSSNDYSILGSSANEDGWTAASLTLPLGAGGGPGFQVVLEGSNGWIVDYDRGTLAGALLNNGVWATWTPPCEGRSYGDAELAGISTKYLVAFCPPNLDANNPPPAALFASTDGGQSFHELTSTLPSSVGSLTGSPNGALFCFDPQGIAASFDGGATWQTALSLAADQSSPAPSVGIAFVTSSVGYATTPTGELFKTVDSGHYWQSVGLPMA
jgi:photosystem II stability/assembly factor-like uncharacterized protein